MKIYSNYEDSYPQHSVLNKALLHHRYLQAIGYVKHTAKSSCNIQPMHASLPQLFFRKECQEHICEEYVCPGLINDAEDREPISIGKRH